MIPVIPLISRLLWILPAFFPAHIFLFFHTGEPVLQEGKPMRIMFYNVENLFDTTDDPLTLDDEFLPRGERHWTEKRYRKKLNDLCKVIVAVGGWDPPAIIGLCEVENRRVLDDLVSATPLSKYRYQIVHQDSPDERGIDVAMLYLEDFFELLEVQFIPVVHPGDTTWKTRDILYAKGIAMERDTLHLFVNHWPSRSDGQLETEEYRILAATLLRRETDFILKNTPDQDILIVGDFNDNPEDRSIRDVLGAHAPTERISGTGLYNHSRFRKDQLVRGSYKYQMNWYLFDQFILSGTLLSGEGNFSLTAEDFHLFTPGFLLEQDNTYLGMKPFRTYLGFKYLGGFSDHLPVYIDIR